tara:strand:+ start:163 stop:1092 length:930 start_codon:yes stop_codon:yes gene_type:complete
MKWLRWIPWFAFVAGSLVHGEGKERSWTNREGKTIQASYLGGDDRTVTLLKEGRRYVLRLADLSRESQVLAGTLREHNPKNVYQFLERVCLFQEVGDGHKDLRGYAIRWNKSPTLSLFDARKYVKREDTYGYDKAMEKASEVIHGLARQINGALQATKFQLKVVADNDLKADVKVFICTNRAWPNILSKFGYRPVMRRRTRGAMFSYFEQRGVITQAIILLPLQYAGSQPASLSAWEGLALQEICQVLGPANDSPLITESVFNGDKGSLPPKLAPIDKEILEFLYLRVQPGDNRRRFEDSFKEHWDFTR